MHKTIVVEGMPWNTKVMTYVKFRGTLLFMNDTFAKVGTCRTSPSRLARARTSG
jgi:hypothetical protein